MFVSVDAGDRSAEVDQASTSQVKRTKGQRSTSPDVKILQKNNANLARWAA